MPDSLLQSLRDHMLDESQPLAGLLRKCLLLGAESGSDSLRGRARLELNGYGDEDELPPYRRIEGLGLTITQVSGMHWVSGQSITRSQVPANARRFIPEKLDIRQPVEELQGLATNQNLTFGSEGLTVAMGVWNRELGPHGGVMEMSFTASGTVFTGIVGQIRTRLVDLIADLTVSTPLSELPRKEAVDAAVQEHVGDTYNTTVIAPSGALAIGRKARAGLTVDDVRGLLHELRAAAEREDVDDAAGVAESAEALGALLATEGVSTGEVMRETGRLRELAEKVGIPTLSGAAGGVATALTELALAGAFG